MIKHNNVATKLCLVCNKERPMDYFVGEERVCWSCKAKHLDEPGEPPESVAPKPDPNYKPKSEKQQAPDNLKSATLSDNAIELLRVASLSIERRYCTRGCRYYQSKRAYKCSNLKPSDDGSTSCYNFCA